MAGQKGAFQNALDEIDNAKSETRRNVQSSAVKKTTAPTDAADPDRRRKKKRKTKTVPFSL